MVDTDHTKRAIRSPLHERQRVSFGDLVDVHLIMSHHDYTSEEKKATWFDIEEERRMINNARSKSNSKKNRSWIDVFTNYGAISEIISFLDEVDLVLFEAAINILPGGKRRKKSCSKALMTEPQWAYLDKLDRSRKLKRWGDPKPPKRDLSSRGRRYARYALFAMARTEEATNLFDFGREGVIAGQVPRRGQSKLGRKKLLMHRCWRNWVDLDSLKLRYVRGNQGRSRRIVYVFVELAFVRDENDPSKNLSWRGFRKAGCLSNNEISITFDIDSLVEEMGWEELLQFGNFDADNSQQQLKALMQRIQVTVHRADVDVSLRREPSLVIATGGYTIPSTKTHKYHCRKQHFAWFHSRNEHLPMKKIDLLCAESVWRTTSLVISSKSLEICINRFTGLQRAFFNLHQSLQREEPSHV